MKKLLILLLLPMLLQAQAPLIGKRVFHSANKQDTLIINPQDDSIRIYGNRPLAIKGLSNQNIGSTYNFGEGLQNDGNGNISLGGNINSTISFTNGNLNMQFGNIYDNPSFYLNTTYHFNEPYLTNGEPAQINNGLYFSSGGGTNLFWQINYDNQNLSIHKYIGEFYSSFAGSYVPKGGIGFHVTKTGSGRKSLILTDDCTLEYLSDGAGTVVPEFTDNSLVTKQYVDDKDLLKKVSGTFLASDIAAGNEIEIIPAPGIGKTIHVISTHCKWIANTTPSSVNFFMKIGYNNTAVNENIIYISAANLYNTQMLKHLSSMSGNDLENKSIELYPDTPEIDSNGDLKYTVLYTIEDFNP